MLVCGFQSLQGEYLQNFNEKRTERMRETEMEFYEMKETQKQNVMYEEMMAQKRHQHRLQFKHDLDQQIKLKNLENVSILLEFLGFIWMIFL